MTQFRKMPTQWQIASHWIPKLVNDNCTLDLFYDYENHTAEQKKDCCSICFACSMEVGTQRSHIKPKCNGGADNINNLHLLCKECHNESELFEDDIYWQWFKNKNYSNSGSYLRVMNKAKLYTQMIMNNNNLNQLPKILKEHFYDTN